MCSLCDIDLKGDLCSQVFNIATLETLRNLSRPGLAVGRATVVQCSVSDDREVLGSPEELLKLAGTGRKMAEDFLGLAALVRPGSAEGARRVHGPLAKRRSRIAV